MKKKVFVLVLSAVMCFAVTACGDKETGSAKVELTNGAQESAAEFSDETKESVEELSGEEAQTEEAGSADIQMQVEIPDGFSEVSEGMYTAKDGANIIVLTTAATGVIPSEDALIQQFTATLGEEKKVTIEEYELYKVDDYDALRFVANYLVEGSAWTQTQCMIFTDEKLGIAAFTQPKDGEWTELFHNCIENITMK